jgi:hypothetical protein
VKISVGYANKRVTSAEPPTEKAAKPPTIKKSETLVNQGLFRKGFLNLLPIVSVPPTSPQEVINGEVLPFEWLLKWFLPIPELASRF